MIQSSRRYPRVVVKSVFYEGPPPPYKRLLPELVGIAAIDIVADPIEVTLVQRGSFTKTPGGYINISLNQIGYAYPIELTITLCGTWLNFGHIASPFVVTVSQHGTDVLGELFSSSALIPITVTMGAGVNAIGVDLPSIPTMITAPPKSNWVKWSNIGALDFTIWRDNIAGERPTDWKGWIYEIKKLGTKVVVYGQGGVSLLTPAGNVFGFQTVHRLGLISKQAVVGTDAVHYFIDSKNRLCKFDASIEILDYSEYLAELVYPVMSMNTQTGLVYICDGVKGFVYNPGDKSLGSGPVNVTGIAEQVGVLYVVAPAVIATPDPFEICTDIYDMGSRWGKTIRSVEVGTNIVTPISVCIDYRVNKNAGFLQTRWRVVNHRGFVFLPCYGNEFRFRVKAASYEYFELDYIKVIGVIHDN